MYLSIIDTGQGMAAEMLAKIFQPFFSTKPSGSGLGLPTARRIVEGHGGTIDVQSEPGKGTKITLRLRRRLNPPVRKNDDCSPRKRARRNIASR